MLVISLFFYPIHFAPIITIILTITSEAEAQEAIDQLDTAARVTGYAAKGIPKKHARLTIKNTPNDRLPAHIIDTLNRNYEAINNLEAEDGKVATILAKSSMQCKPCHLTGFSQCQQDASELRLSQTGNVCLPDTRLYTATAVLQMLQMWPFGGTARTP